MANEAVNKLAWPIVVSLMTLILGVLINISYVSGQQAAHTENTDKNVQEIKEQVKENNKKYSSLEREVRGMDYRLDTLISRSDKWYNIKNTTKKNKP